jgi:drug/metabolite transporter (DMT)-like permease
MGFALNNVLSVKTAQVLPQMRQEMRTVVIFGGAALFGAVAACFEPMVTPPSGARLAYAALLSLGLGCVLGCTNLLVQAGMVRVRANRASVVMLFELVVTALTAWWLAHEVPGPREWAGGACIVLASVLSGWVHRPSPELLPRAE